MWCSVVSLGLVLVLGAPQQQAAMVDPAWMRVKSAIVQFEGLGQNSGLAVLIDSRGYFLTHRSAFSIQPVVARTDAGQTIMLSLVATDEQTQLALLKSESLSTGPKTVVRVAEKPAPGAQLIAATTVGPVRGELVNNGVVGQMRPTLRYVPLNEVRLESNTSPVGGALVFDSEGALVGLLGATLGSPRGSALSPGGIAGGGSGSRAKTDAFPETAAQPKALAKQYGPQGLTVAYSLDTTVLKRVVRGFLSESHKVEHPSIGVFFKSSAEPGALIEETVADSPATKAGIRVGDVIVEFGGNKIAGPVDLARRLFECNVGDEIEVKVRRAGAVLSMTVIVGAQSEA